MDLTQPESNHVDIVSELLTNRVKIAQNKNPLIINGLRELWSRPESNWNPGLRRPLYYPLYYGTL